MNRDGKRKRGRGRKSLCTFSQSSNVCLDTLVNFSSEARLNFNDVELLLADACSPHRPRERLAAGAAF